MGEIEKERLKNLAEALSAEERMQILEAFETEVLMEELTRRMHEMKRILNNIYEIVRDGE